jgi:hypothetical protein
MTRVELTQEVGTSAQWPEAGQVYRDQVAGAMMLVLTAPALPGFLRCNGVPMVLAHPLPCSYSRGAVRGALEPGRCYRDAYTGIEVRCLRGGRGHLTYDHLPLIAV